MSEMELSLFNAILENPDDDLPRLVFADFLEENDDPKRAEFIRMQISIASYIEDDQLDSPEYVRAVKYSVSLLPEDYVPWIVLNRFCLTDTANPYVSFDKDAILFRISNSYVNLEYRRGFLNALTAPAHWILLNFDKIIEQPIERIHFRPDQHFHHGDLTIHFKDGEWITQLAFDAQTRFEMNWGPQRSEIKNVPEWLTKIWSDHPWYQERIRRNRLYEEQQRLRRSQ